MLAQDYAKTAAADDRVQMDARLMGMLHDIGECIVGDVIYPLKSGAFKHEYDTTMGQLERDFRHWAAEYAFGVKDFGKRMEETSSFVDAADRLMGEMELYGISSVGRYNFGYYGKPMFEALLNDATEDQFRVTLDALTSSKGDEQ